MNKAIRLICCCIGVGMPALGAAQPAPPSSYKPGLGDLMTMTVQPRHTKLGLAGQAGNWTYAVYELHELQEAFDRVVRISPRWRDFAVADMMPSVTKEPMAALADAIQDSNPERFTKAYRQLTEACNQCHQSAERGMIVIQVPAASPFPDQDFQPPRH